MGSCEIVAGSVTKVFGTSVSYTYPSPFMGLGDACRSRNRGLGTIQQLKFDLQRGKRQGVCVYAGRRGGVNHIRRLSKVELLFSHIYLQDLFRIH